MTKMKRIVTIFGIICIFLISISCSSANVILEDGSSKIEDKYAFSFMNIQSDTESDANIIQEKLEFVPGELIIQLKEDVSINVKRLKKGGVKTGITSLDILNELHSVSNLEKVFNLDYIRLSKFYKLTLPIDCNISLAIEDFEANPYVDYAEPNYVMTTCITPNDPYYHSYGSWGQDYLDLYGLHIIQARKAWDMTIGSHDVVVAVIDSGVDYTHEDLQDNMWINEDEIPGNEIDDDSDGFIDNIYGADFAYDDSDPMDGNGHGTHCAGTIAAVGNNAVGVVGVNWQARIMTVKGLNDAGRGNTEDLANAIIWAADNGANVISMSWGGGRYSETMKYALDYAYDNDVILVAAAGNDNTDAMQYPSGYDNVIAVAAIDRNNQKAGFSNYGSWIDVCAPGVKILSTYPENLSITRPGNIIVNSDDMRIRTYSMLYSSSPPEEGLYGQLLYVDGGYPEDFESQNFTGKIALINDHELYFRDIVQNAADAGAIGAIIFVEGWDLFRGTLFEPSEIPAFSISDTDGWSLYQLIQEEDTFITISLINLGYNIASGTSMACPHVAGLAALILARNPNYSNVEVREIISSTADNINTLNPGFEGLLGSGRINAGRAIPPEYNVGVESLDFPDHVKSDKMIYINATLINDGLNDMTDIFVSFLVNNTELNNITIPFFESQTTQSVSFPWTPLSVGMYNVTIIVNTTNVVEDRYLDNEKSKIVIIGVFNVDTTECFDTIQGAVDDSDTLNGHCILVPSGIFQENIVIKKDISLIGRTKDTTVIEGAGAISSVVIIENVDFVNIMRFSIRNGTNGVYIKSSSNTTIKDTFISNNIEAGIYLESSDHVSVITSWIFNNTLGVIMTIGSNNNTLIENIIISNNKGLKIDSGCNNNNIYHNNFINNTLGNAYDYSSNIWDEGYPLYPSCGNYWDDYASGDNFLGPYQNISGSDGIGDIPYDIPCSDNQDRYPLMNPWNNTFTVPPAYTVYIDDDFNETTLGWGWDHFNQIQEGIDLLVGSGDVYVYTGTYYENLKIDKTINFIGEDRNTTIINGGGSGDVVRVNADWVNISGFTFTSSGSGGNDAGIYVRSDNNNISKTIITNSKRGVLLTPWTSSNNIIGNKVTNNLHGLSLFGQSNNIKGNTITDNNYGIYLYTAIYNHIAENIIRGNNHGIYLEMFWSKENIIVRNKIANNNECGVSLMGSSNNIISENHIIGNILGIQFYNYDSSADNNHIYHNNFINNFQNAYDECNNIWDDEISIGNYWYDYTGIDADFDGIGDTPYQIPGGENQDQYPLIEPHNTLCADANGPYANFVANPVHFTGTATGGFPPYSWHWNFGDGNESYEQNPTHIYDAAGNYTVELTVIDSIDYYNGRDTTIATIKKAPDLIIPDLSAKQIRDTTMNLITTVENIGDLDVTIPFQVAFYGTYTLPDPNSQQAPPTIQIGTVEIPYLTLDQSIEANMLWEINPKIVAIYAVADSLNIIEESNETNNSAWIIIK